MRRSEAVLTSTDNLCFGGKISKIGTEWILGFCQDGPTPPSHSQKGANVESSRGPYESTFSQEDLTEWSPPVINQQQLFSVIGFTYRIYQDDGQFTHSHKNEYVDFNISSHLGVSHNVQSLLNVCCSESALFSLDYLLGPFD